VLDAEKQREASGATPARVRRGGRVHQELGRCWWRSISQRHRRGHRGCGRRRDDTSTAPAAKPNRQEAARVTAGAHGRRGRASRRRRIEGGYQEGVATACGNAGRGQQRPGRRQAAAHHERQNEIERGERIFCFRVESQSSPSARAYFPPIAGRCTSRLGALPSWDSSKKKKHFRRGPQKMWPNNRHVFYLFSV
jgi:hypothetical protein